MIVFLPFLWFVDGHTIALQRLSVNDKYPFTVDIYTPHKYTRRFQRGFVQFNGTFYYVKKPPVLKAGG